MADIRRRSPEPPIGPIGPIGWSGPAPIGTPASLPGVVRAAHFGGLPVSIPVNGRMDTGRLP
jgi:hypothetical protein